MLRYFCTITQKVCAWMKIKYEWHQIRHWRNNRAEVNTRQGAFGEVALLTRRFGAARGGLSTELGVPSKVARAIVRTRAVRANGNNRRDSPWGVFWFRAPRPSAAAITHAHRESARNETGRGRQRERGSTRRTREGKEGKIDHPPPPSAPLDVPVAQIDVRRHEPRSSDAKWEWRALRIHDSLNISIVSAVPGVREAERTRECFGRAAGEEGRGGEPHRARGSLDAVEDYNNCELIGQRSWPNRHRVKHGGVFNPSTAP